MDSNSATEKKDSTQSTSKRTSNQDVLAVIAEFAAEDMVFVSEDNTIHHVDARAYDEVVKLRNVMDRLADTGISFVENTITHAELRNLVTGTTTNVTGIDGARKFESNRDVDELLNHAFAFTGTTDVHVNVKGGQTEIYYRVHGFRKLIKKLDSDTGTSIIMSLTNAYAASTKRFSENVDGEFEFKMSTEEIVLVRLSTTWLVDTGDMTCKLRFRPRNHIIPLADMGYTEKQLDDIALMTTRQAGLLPIIGATGSGKSTTLSSILSDMDASRAIMELSDTPEVRLSNVEHVRLPQEGEDIDARLDSVLKGCVRQDTDVFSVGEMRDKVTARFAEVVGLQGKFVFTTGHGSNAVAFYRRMISESDFAMSKETVLSPNFLVGIISQTLVGLICKSCGTNLPEYELGESVKRQVDSLIESVGSAERDKLRFRSPDGCRTCRSTGYTGRSVLAEVLVFDEAIRSYLAQTDFAGLQAHMKANGITSMLDQGRDHILAGSMDPFDVAFAMNVSLASLFMEQTA